jgi:hypothetical protein
MRTTCVISGSHSKYALASYPSSRASFVRRHVRDEAMTMESGGHTSQLNCIHGSLVLPCVNAGCTGLSRI